MFLCLLVAGASLCHAAAPDLTPYKPDNWNDKIPIGISPLAFDQAHTYTGPYYSNQTLYFNWGSLNQGTADVLSSYTIRFEVNGTGGVILNWAPVPPLAPGHWTYLTTDLGVGPLSEGNHTFKLWLDYTGVVSESNESNNYYERTINVESPTAPTPTPTPTTLTPTPMPIPQAEMVLNGASFARGDFFSATFKLNRSIEQPFTVFAVVIMPDGSMLDALTLGPNVEPIASNVPRLDFPFSYPLLSLNLPAGAPLGNYEVVVVFFDPSKPIRGRADAFLDVSGKFGIGAPAPTPTPALDWYAQYGPGGTNDVVKKEKIYVAVFQDRPGCAELGTKTWQGAIDWANGLSWLDKDDWRMPTKDELWMMAMNPGDYGAIPGCYWSSTDYGDAYPDMAYAYGWGGTMCANNFKTDLDFVRAVRDVE